MADPNDPWAAFNPQAAQAPSAFGGRPVIQQQMTPQDQAQLTRTQQEIGNNDLQRQSTQTNIQQNQQSMQNQRFNQNQGLRQEFNNLPEVKNYGVAANSLNTALKAPDTPQGDLAIIYAYAKAADPGSVVREGEMDMATATASLPEAYKAAAQRLTQGKRLPPEVRTGLIETMRQSVAGMKGLYDQQRARYGTLAQQNGFDPNQIVGQPLYDAVRPAEEAYITAHGGTPRDPYAPQDPNAPVQQAPAAPTITEQGFGLHPTGSTPSASSEDFRNQLYSAMKAGQIKSPADMEAWQADYNKSHNTGWRIDVNNPDTRRAIAAARGGKAFNVDTPVPNISNAPQGSGPAFVRGAADTATLGLRDKIVAAGDALQNGSPFSYELQRQYALSDADQQNNPYARFGGQIAGGFALPMGETESLANLSAKGAGYGAAYGLGSSRSLNDIPANVAGGAAVGAAVPAVLGKVFTPKQPGVVDPLVDPVTGELNQPMVDSMTPAQRAAVMQSYGMKTLTPGMVGGRSARVLEQGLNNVPGSAGVMEDVNAAASGELRRSMQGVAQQFGTSKTMAEGGSALQQGANDYISRGQQVIGKAYQAIPIADTAPASTSATTATLQNLTSRFQSNPDLAAALKDPQLVRYLGAAQKGMSWQDLKQFRTIIGEKIGDARFGESSSTSDLRALYGALTQDMQNTAAAAGPRATAAFNRANDLYRNQQQLIENSLTRILGKDGQMSPERAAAAVQAMTQGGKAGGDIRTLAQIKAATVKSGAWDEIASTLIHLGGQPAKSEGRAFSPQTFVQWYSDMSEQARAMLFKPELRKSLDGFVAMNQQLSRLKGLTNTSNTTPTMIGSGVIAAGGLAAVTHPIAIAGIVAGGAANYGMAKLWTNPAFIKLMTGMGRASLTANPNAINSQVGRLAKFAAQNPEFSEPVQQILRQIANDNTIGHVAASPDPNGNQNQQ